MEGSVLEFIGAELIGVMSPVSICMLLVVLLVFSHSPSPSLSSFPTTSAPAFVVTAANFLYAENPEDSTAQKLEGALLNAAIFIIFIAAATFLLVLLYYYNFTNFLKNYMRLSAFFVLHFSIPVDAVTCIVSHFNFTVLGVISVFGKGVPIAVTQAYMVILGIIMAAWFTQLPEWTTWTLLVSLAVYDLVAVLAPGGPLKILAELSQSRDDDLPALAYEARPTVSSRSSAAAGRRGSSLGILIAGVSDNDSVELQPVAPRNYANEVEGGHIDENLDVEAARNDKAGEEEETSPLILENLIESDRISSSLDGSEIGAVNEEMSPLVDTLAFGDERDGGDSHTRGRTRGIALGLGDFVFYSVLLGRAALYDLMTVYACYLAIISGLACTLILLSVCGRALPALPISITLGVIFYFLTRLLMEPFVVGTSTNLMMF
ncbi:hypothetical protein Nepgr_011500 [Nepenthes gracilis]|uniref:Presenilin n=1 Tax=Nepenthes gracilis TaxID=150966 RepID=A0AAD3XMD3_NEPGR|nr:hypothetical protein Nepgr_011500 [Nepenthes gracilis]